MENEYNVNQLAATIDQLREKTEALMQSAEGIPAVERNCTRLLASIKMLELNLSYAVIPYQE